MSEPEYPIVAAGYNRQSRETYPQPTIDPEDVSPGDILVLRNGKRITVDKIDPPEHSRKGRITRYVRFYWWGKGYGAIDHKGTPGIVREWQCLLLSEAVALVKANGTEQAVQFDQSKVNERVASYLHQMPGAQPCDCGKNGRTIPNGKCRLCLDCGAGVGTCGI